MSTPVKPNAGLTLGEAIQRTGLTKWQIWGMRQRDELRYCRVGKSLRFHPDDVAAISDTIWKGSPVQPRTAA